MYDTTIHKVLVLWTSPSWMIYTNMALRTKKWACTYVSICY